MAMTGNEARQLFIDYFAKKRSPACQKLFACPVWRPYPAFHKCGNVQFKRVWLRRMRQITAVTSRNASVRRKDNDLENVGYTARHHTFLKCCGNFSFDDYFARKSHRNGLGSSYKRLQAACWQTLGINILMMMKHIKYGAGPTTG